MSRRMLVIPGVIDNDQEAAEKFADEQCEAEGLTRTGPIKFDYAGKPFILFDAVDNSRDTV